MVYQSLLLHNGAQELPGLLRPLHLFLQVLVPNVHFPARSSVVVLILNPGEEFEPRREAEVLHFAPFRRAGFLLFLLVLVLRVVVDWRLGHIELHIPLDIIQFLLQLLVPSVIPALVRGFEEVHCDEVVGEVVVDSEEVVAVVV